MMLALQNLNTRITLDYNLNNKHIGCYTNAFFRLFNEISGFDCFPLNDYFPFEIIVILGTIDGF